jgi:hypothetical protein
MPKATATNVPGHPPPPPCRSQNLRRSRRNQKHCVAAPLHTPPDDKEHQGIDMLCKSKAAM